MHTESESVDYKYVTEDKLNTAIELGINYLHGHQLPNGEFLMYMSGDDAMQGWILPESCVFPAALIGNCLLPLKKQKKVKKILTDTAEFLKYQMDKGGTWNHYTILHRLRNLCPQDLDDTACISHFLKQMNYDIPTKRNQQLILDNRRKDGLFYTWITFRWRANKNVLYWYYATKELKNLFKSLAFWHKFECSRYDVDAVVNANILYYLGKNCKTEPIATYLIHIINSEKEGDCDAWYHSIFTIYYFITRNYRAGILELEKVRNVMIGRIISKHQKNGSFGESELDTALAITSLINLKYEGKEIRQGINNLINTQHENGNWKRWAFYYTGPTGSCLGSEELTTGFCLEALARFRNLQKT